MKYLLIVLFLGTTLYGKAQYQPPVDKIKTVIDYKKGRFLDSLMAIVGNKRIVALGEDTHGTAEFYALRAAITQRLIKEKGFNIVILENPHEDMMALQEGLPTGKLDTLMRRHLFSIYQTKQMQEFLQWFKKYSRKHAALRLAGCDDSYYEILPQLLIKEAAKYGNDNLNNMCHEFLLRQTLSVKEFYARSSQPKPDSLPNDMQYGRATYRLLNKIDSLCEGQKIQDPKLKELIFHAKTAYVYYDRFAKKLAVSRDEIMGDRINYYAADPGAKIVVWAHSGHISKSAWLNDELGLMGATVSKKFPADYMAIGISGGQGSYSYIKNRFINNDHRFTDSLFNGNLHKSKVGSWNELLMGNAAENYFLDFSKLNTTERNELDKKRPLKMMGYGKESDTEKEYYDVSLGQLFDVLIFLKNTTHTMALFN
ncbi:MAG TPA: erythromycin esterase family protein [Niastella sp.]